MEELEFSAAYRYRPYWPDARQLLALLAFPAACGYTTAGVLGGCMVLAGTGVVLGLWHLATSRARTTVGAAGITVSHGIGRGRTYGWQEVRWVDAAAFVELKEPAEVARITLANGRRRTLPGLSRSRRYPDSGFAADLRRVVGWWELRTLPASRIQPSEGRSLTPLMSRHLPDVLALALGCAVVLLTVN
ncbi:PH domain-containing protein [Kitasatospora viridis]|uniref:PH domain-containing protein n=1 Tax=Kitasatospora viridis TaxID=281105 RepID=UPI0011A3E6CD|nr:PH domain-containing protein [Kitasatospora viridis]